MAWPQCSTSCKGVVLQSPCNSPARQTLTCRCPPQWIQPFQACRPLKPSQRKLPALRAVKGDSKPNLKEDKTASGEPEHGPGAHLARDTKAAVESTAKETGRKVEDTAEENNNFAKIAAPAGLILGLLLIGGGGYLFKDQLRGFIDYFVEAAEEWGPLGYVAYGVVYTLLEILAVPAVPLTMTAGIVFGPVPGVIVVSGAATAAATIAFLIARYAARDKVLELAQGNAKFKAVDRAIGRNGFRVVTLLRLSPLLPLALSNYFYGLTSVDLPSYVAASWLGMLPGTILYVTAGDYGRELIDAGEGGIPVSKWQVGLGIGVTLLILGYIGKLAKKALDDAEEEMAAEK